MKDLWGALFIGVLIGAAATVYYMNNEQKLEQRGHRIIARTKRAVNLAHNASKNMGGLGEQG